VRSRVAKVVVGAMRLVTPPARTQPSHVPNWVKRVMSTALRVESNAFMRVRSSSSAGARDTNVRSHAMPCAFSAHAKCSRRIGSTTVSEIGPTSSCVGSFGASREACSVCCTPSGPRKEKCASITWRCG
jgi:hypothetical protein